MKRFLMCLAGLMFIISSAAQGQLEVEEGYIPALPPSMKNSAAYFVLRNHGQETVVLTGARTAVADRAELHETVSRDGQMHMSRLESVEIPPGEMITLESGGMHFMLMGLQSAPAPGENISLMLEFEGGLELPLSLPVRSLLPEDSGEDDRQH